MRLNIIIALLQTHKLLRSGSGDGLSFVFLPDWFKLAHLSPTEILMI